MAGRNEMVAVNCMACLVSEHKTTARRLKGERMTHAESVQRPLYPPCDLEETGLWLNLDPSPDFPKGLGWTLA